MTKKTDHLKTASDSFALPGPVLAVLRKLSEKRYEAFVVGGCVRDILMGKEPADWDICTSCKPAEIKEIFAGFKTLDTGIKHGTVTVIVENMPIEITTYRVDGDYIDGRHPQQVIFTKNLQEDLRRRDFTVNAMAYRPGAGVIDPFGGRKDLFRRIIRCVGPDAKKRFEEDGLRILRGLRFAATLGFTLDGCTEKAMRQCVSLTERISRERVSGELSGLLLGFDAVRVLKTYGDILKTVVPGLKPEGMTEDMPEILQVRLAAVFPKETENYLRKLRFGGKTIREASALSRLFSMNPPQTPVEIRMLLAAEGEEICRMYFAGIGRLSDLEKVLNSGICRELAQLAVTGKDLIRAGFKPGPDVGKTLKKLLHLVMGEVLENDKQLLLKYVEEEIKKRGKVNGNQ